jgi:hypothetical protein
MMFRKKIIAVLVVLGISVCGTASSTVVKYKFSQSGYDEGAIVTGMFEGEDVDGDGFLTFRDGDLAGFSMEFSGNSIVPAFTSNFISPTTDAVIYELNGGPLGDFPDENSPFGTGEIIFTQHFSAGFDVNKDLCGGKFCGVVNGLADSSPYTISSELVKVSAVPVPAAVWLFSSGLLALFGVQRNKSKFSKSLA